VGQGQLALQLIAESPSAVGGHRPAVAHYAPAQGCVCVCVGGGGGGGGASILSPYCQQMLCVVGVVVYGFALSLPTCSTTANLQE
jgi:hypothetical protein